MNKIIKNKLKKNSLRALLSSIIILIPFIIVLGFSEFLFFLFGLNFVCITLGGIIVDLIYMLREIKKKE